MSCCCCPSLQVTVRSDLDDSVIAGAKLEVVEEEEEEEHGEDPVHYTDSQGRTTVLERRPYGTREVKVKVMVSKDGYRDHRGVSKGRGGKTPGFVRLVFFLARMPPKVQKNLGGIDLGLEVSKPDFCQSFAD